MKLLPPVLFCMALLSLAQAQTPATYDPAVDAQERARIESERQTEQARFAREEEACYQRFAVNDCLRKVRKYRRAVLEELRRQEIILNDARRAAAAAEQLQRSDEKAAARTSPEAIRQRAEAESAQKERLEQARRKMAEKEAKEGRAPVETPGPVEQPSVGDSAQRAAMQKAYEEKQKQALERRRAMDKAKAEKGGQSGRPLPVPP